MYPGELNEQMAIDTIQIRSSALGIPSVLWIALSTAGNNFVGRSCVDQSSSRLKLPEGSRVHDTFHMSGVTGFNTVYRIWAAASF
jgi:hypothetical protein